MDCLCGRQIVYTSKSLCRSCYRKQWRESNKDHLCLLKKQWSKNNKEKKAKIESDWRFRNKDNKQVFLRKIVRNRLSDAISGISNYKTTDLIGCSIEELKKYIESKFKPNMNWSNHSLKGWHIDHIEPLSSFDLTNEQDLKYACNYKNLQPIWAEEHIIKTAKEQR